MLALPSAGDYRARHVPEATVWVGERAFSLEEVGCHPRRTRRK